MAGVKPGAGINMLFTQSQLWQLQHELSKLPETVLPKEQRTIMLCGGLFNLDSACSLDEVEAASCAKRLLGIYSDVLFAECQPDADPQ